MPNNLVFNNVASELQVQIFGLNGSNVKAVAVDASGNFVVSVSTVTIASGTFTVSGGTIDVVSALSAGTVTVRGGTIDVVSALSAGTVTVTGGTIQQIPAFTETSTTIAVGTSTVDALEIDTSTQKVYSFYVANSAGTGIITALLQISPTNVATFYVNDTSTALTIAPGVKGVLVAAEFLRFTKLQLIATAAASAICYFDAQS
jgi:hypothetical protein